MIQYKEALVSSIHENNKNVFLNKRKAAEAKVLRYCPSSLTSSEQPLISTQGDISHLLSAAQAYFLCAASLCCRTHLCSNPMTDSPWFCRQLTFLMDSGPRTAWILWISVSLPLPLCIGNVFLFAPSLFSMAGGEEEITSSFPRHLHPSCSRGIWAAFQISICSGSGAEGGQADRDMSQWVRLQSCSFWDLSVLATPVMAV